MLSQVSLRRAPVAASSLLRTRFASSATGHSHRASNTSSSSSWLPSLFAGACGFAACQLAYEYGNDALIAATNPVLMPLIRVFDPETSHNLSITAASHDIMPKDRTIDDDILHVSAFGLEFMNPMGMAAGFDKHAEGMGGIFNLGFGAVEIGSVTPLPQDGNPKPRLFRLWEDKGVINRYGFNSHGHEVVAERLSAFMESREAMKSHVLNMRQKGGVVGVNLGKNKTSASAVDDYVAGVKSLGPYADYLVINVSSPNTPGLRNLQGKAQLKKLIQSVQIARDQFAVRNGKKPSLLVKIAPDLTNQDMKDIADVALETNLDGLIISNTTVSRPEFLKSDTKSETGGLSGAPVREISTQVLRSMYKLTKGRIPLIGVGGVSSGKDAYEKICAGATLVQIYSCMVYDGPLAGMTAKQELKEILKANGYKNVQEAVGSKVDL